MSTPPSAAPTGWSGLLKMSGYQWFVFIVCCLAWDMDCMDQQLFVLARRPAMTDLVPKPDLPDAAEAKKAFDGAVAEAAGYATMWFMVGWAVGGIGFGILGDRIGRVKTLTMTILLYAIFTGLSAFSLSTTDFFLYRFLTGLGVGGVFAASVTLLAETVPDGVRPLALGLFQASSVLGNCTAALLSMWFGSQGMKESISQLSLGGVALTPWKLMFLVGIIPGLLVVVVQLFLKEPERWKQLKAEGKKGGSYQELLGDPRWRRNALFGLMLALAGVVGLWGIAFFSPDLQSYVAEPQYKQEAVEKGLATAEQVAENKLPAEAMKYVNGEKAWWAGVTSLVQNMGAFVGIFVFSAVTAIIGRKPTFAIFFVLAGISTACVFLFLNKWSDIFWMVPIMGFCQLAVFGGYAIYFPELFPTRLRSTGTSFCYNVGRLVSAFGPAALGLLTSVVFKELPAPEPLRYAGVTMCSVFLIGLIALPFLPETRGKPLPE